jgi:long-chain fatty acid transport protein
MKRSLYAVVFSMVLVMGSTAAFATNGMDLEGYGPIATGMGGASMAYDNGTAAMMNNPATLGLMAPGSRLDVALGYLGPHVKAEAGGESATSSANAFYMPALGWVKKTGKIAFGAGVFSQGGMGTEFDGNSFLAAGSGEKVRSELGVGRVLFPIAYNVNDQFTVGGSLDFVWAGLDLKMALDGAQFADMVGPSFGGAQTYGKVSGSLVNTLLGAFGAPPAPLQGLNWARFDFSDNSAFTEAAKGTGYAAKIGAVYKVNNALSLGATYHSTTWLGDMEAKGAKLSMNVAGVGVPGGTATVPVSGTIKVKDFQWPQTIGLGAAYQVNNQLMLVFDYKWINWKDVMKSFKMNFTADATQADPMAGAFGLGGQSMDAEMYQNWKDQNVFIIGAAYKFTKEFTGRIGYNYANNPIPDTYLNPLFPAIEKSHITFGGGYMISKASSVDASFTYAPEVSQKNGQGVTMKHYQTNAQLMYSYRF